MLIERIKQAAKKRLRFGQDLVTVLLRKSGLGINHKRVERLWRQEGLQVPGESGGKRGDWSLWTIASSGYRLSMRTTCGPAISCQTRRRTAGS